MQPTHVTDGPTFPPFAPRPMPVDAVTSPQFVSEAAAIRQGDATRRLVACLLMAGGVAATILTYLIASPGGRFVIFFGPIFAGGRLFNRVRTRMRLADFYDETAGRWAAGAGADGRPMSRTAVMAEWERRESERGRGSKAVVVAAVAIAVLGVVLVVLIPAGP